MDPDRPADAVERHDCPKCAAPAGSPCRTAPGRYVFENEFDPDA
ncbi:zinc finger domain-containing protein [Embleya sp. NPDC001921]